MDAAGFLEDVEAGQHPLALRVTSKTRSPFTRCFPARQTPDAPCRTARPPPPAPRVSGAAPTLLAQVKSIWGSRCTRPGPKRGCWRNNTPASPPRRPSGADNTSDGITAFENARGCSNSTSPGGVAARARRMHILDVQRVAAGRLRERAVAHLRRRQARLVAARSNTGKPSTQRRTVPVAGARETCWSRCDRSPQNPVSAR